MMTIGELIGLLEQASEYSEYGDETEVRFAAQPEYPFEYSIDFVELSGEIVYLSEGEQIGYLPGDVIAMLGW